MPADSDAAAAAPALPQTFRPFGVRVAFYVAGAALAAVAAFTWFAFPPDVRDQFTLFQRITLAVLGLGFYGIGWGLVRSRVVAREGGITIVNGYRTHRLEWNEVLAVNLRRGSPWVMVDVADGTTVAAMGIQGSDGDRARRQVQQVRALVAAYTR